MSGLCLVTIAGEIVLRNLAHFVGELRQLLASKYGVTTTRSAVAEFDLRAVRSGPGSPEVEFGARRAVTRGSSPYFTHQGGA